MCVKYQLLEKVKLATKKKRKLSRSAHEAQLAIARRNNPGFRKQEELQKKMVDTGVEYLAVVAYRGDVDKFVEEYADVIDEVGGLDALHGFLGTFELLVPEWEEFIDAEGRITSDAVHENGYEIVDDHLKEKAAAK